MNWTQQEAIALCTQIEAVCPPFGCHVALTGGLLYKQGERKDADIMLYRIRQVEEINLAGLWEEMEKLGVVRTSEEVPYGESWCIKATYNGKSIDFFFPEAPSLGTVAAADDFADVLL